MPNDHLPIQAPPVPDTPTPAPVVIADSQPETAPVNDTPTATPVRPMFTVKVGEASLQVEVSQTVRVGEDYHRMGGALVLPLGPDGRYDAAQLEGALAAFTVVAARLERQVSQAWQIQHQALRAARQRAQMTARLSTALQSLCVPPSEAEAALVEFFGGLSDSPAGLQATLAKIMAMRGIADRPEGWRWRVPAQPSKQKAVGDGRNPPQAATPRKPIATPAAPKAPTAVPAQTPAGN